MAYLGKNIHKIYMVIFALILLCILGYGMEKVMCFSIFPDEFGYWSTAATLAGYEWQDYSSMGYYYSFGYGFLLYPILLICGGGVSAYHVAIFLNVLLQITALYLLYSLLQKSTVRPATKGAEEPFAKLECMMAAALGIFYPSWIFYSQMTLVEGLLSFLFIAICYVMESYFRNRKRWQLILLLVLCAYMYMVHLRAIAVWIACLLVLGTDYFFGEKAKSNHTSHDSFVKKRDKADALVFFLLGSVGLFLLAQCGKSWTLREVFPYLSKDNLGVNTYENQWRKIQDIFSLTGVKDLLVSLCGKAFYLWVATLGLLPVFLGHFDWKKLRKQARKKQSRFDALIPDSWTAVAVMVALACAVELLICSIYMMKGSRLDHFVYGRYLDYLVPMIVAMGIRGLQNTESCSLKAFVSLRSRLKAGGMELTAFLVLGVVPYLAMKNKEVPGFRGFMMTALSWYLELAKALEKHLSLMGDVTSNQGEPIDWFFLCIFAGTIILGLLIRTLAFWGKRERSMVLLLIVGTEILAALWCANQYTYSFNAPHYSDKAVVEYLEAWPGECYFLKDGRRSYVDAIQFQLGEKRLVPIEMDENAFTSWDSIMAEHYPIVLVYTWSDYVPELMGYYNNHISTDTYYLFWR